MNLIDVSALRALVAEEVRRVLAAEQAAPPAASAAATAPSIANLWSATQVAKYLGASRSWVYDQAQAGLMPCLKIGGLLRFDPKEVQAFVRGQSAAPTPLRAAGGRRGSS